MVLPRIQGLLNNSLSIIISKIFNEVFYSFILNKPLNLLNLEVLVIS